MLGFCEPCLFSLLGFCVGMEAKIRNLKQFVEDCCRLWIFMVVLGISALHDIECFLQNKESLSVLVVGKGGVGKSSTVNSIIGERVTVVSAFQVTGRIRAQLV